MRRRSQQQSADTMRRQSGAVETASASEWQQRLATEMKLAQAQWNELLQTSLDGSIERLVEQLSGRAQEVLGSAEQKMMERFAELRQPLSHMYTEARDTLSGVRAALEHEVGRARSSLAEIEHAAGRMKEYSAQLEAASHDTLNELHRRLENILEAQTDEMNRRAAARGGGSAATVWRPTLDHLGNQLVERTMAEVEAKACAAHRARAGIAARAGESRSGIGEQLAAAPRAACARFRKTVSAMWRARSPPPSAACSNDFEGARKEALMKWSEELDASGVRASHAAAESIGKSSEWFQQEAQARLQVLVEQALITVGSGFEEKTTEAGRQFDARLEEQSTKHARREFSSSSTDWPREFRTARIRSSTRRRNRRRLRSARSCAAFPMTSWASSPAAATKRWRSASSELQGYSDQVVRNLDGSATEPDGAISGGDGRDSETRIWRKGAPHWRRNSLRRLTAIGWSATRMTRPGLIIWIAWDARRRKNIRIVWMRRAIPGSFRRCAGSTSMGRT